MCGIAGRVGSPVAPAKLAEALRALEHRGPDARGQWSDAGVTLLHRRLAVLDLSPSGAQPMRRPAGAVGASSDIAIVHNGEVYNYVELRDVLAREGVAFEGSSDTEVILEGFRAWGIDGLLRRARGMFAFAIWDGPGRTLHLARDPLGKKPLLYRRDGEGLAFASTLPALLALSGKRPDVDPVGLTHYLEGLSTGARSIAKGVEKVPPGHRLELGPWMTSPKVVPFFRFAARPERGAVSRAAWLERVEHELLAATELRLRADVPVGVFLSGGVDSSLVAALAAKVSGHRVRTISADVPGVGLSEASHARAVARHLGTDHRELRVEPDLLHRLPWLAFCAGEPFADPALLPTAWLAAEAKRDVTVVLTGDGGDEAFAGYPTALLATALRAYRRLAPDALRSAVDQAIRRARERHPRAPALRRLAHVLAPGAFERETWRFDPAGLRGFRGRLDELLRPELRAEVGPGQRLDDHWDEAYARFALGGRDRGVGATAADAALATELVTVLPDLLLPKTDVATMAYGVEARSPLLDVRVIDLAMRIPAAEKIRRGEPKSLLKELAARHVPRDVIYRRKQGFSLPLGPWFRGPLEAPFEGLVLARDAVIADYLDPNAVRRLFAAHRSGREDHGQRLWALLMLELWGRVHLRGDLEPTASIA